MKYISTRGNTPPYSAAETIKRGIAPDGGLFVPAQVANKKTLGPLKSLSYQKLAEEIMFPYIDEFPLGKVQQGIELAYNEDNFSAPDIAPIYQADQNTFFLELWHGPTCAFKDMALQILPHLLSTSIKESREDAELMILVATSGDTGTAALAGFRNVPGTRLIVFYPEEGVSEIQKKQMITQEGNNLHVIAVKGNFDDAQNGVKSIFTNEKIREQLAGAGFKFSSANSINWGRLVPQIVYYFHSYLELIRKGIISETEKEPVNFVVPTGNFGNILAGYYAMQMGLPINRLICASNQNNVLTEFINTGIYNKQRQFVRTISPSMDILISSNLERLLFEITGRDATLTSQWMHELASNGEYRVDNETHGIIKDIFWSDFATDEETREAIRATYNKYNYLIDTHTAVATCVNSKYRDQTGDNTPSVIVSTASPFKFNDSVAKAILDKERVINKSEFELLNILADTTGQNIPAPLRDLNKKEEIHKTVVSKEQMQDVLLDLIK